MSEHHKRLGRAAQQAFRWAVILRDNFTCQKCFRFGGRLESHHLTPLSKGGSNEPQNGQTQCRSCHIAQHRPVRPPERKAWDRLVSKTLSS